MRSSQANIGGGIFMRCLQNVPHNNTKQFDPTIWHNGTYLTTGVHGHMRLHHKHTIPTKTKLQELSFI